MKTLEARLRRIRKGGDGDIVVLHGPRGNGKTVLLRETERNAEASGVTVRALIDGVMRGDDAKVAQYLKDGLDAPKRKVKPPGAGAMSAKANSEFEGAVGPVTAQTLNALLKKRPVLLVVDDAHVMPIGFGRGLLEVAQLLIGQGMPLLLALAGTPGLISHIRKTGAGFWERSKRLRIGRLESEDDVRRAIAVPAERAGLPADEDALALLVRESQGYPHFIQLLAAAAWDAAVSRKGPTRMELRDARAGVAKAETDKLDFCLERFNEANKQGVLAAATAVSREMVARGTSPKLENHELMKVLETATSGSQETALSVCEKLSMLGFIWQLPAGEWEPGIPSLCAHFVEEDRKATGKGA